MDQRLDQVDYQEATALFTDSDGILRMEKRRVEKPRPDDTLPNCIPCFGCKVAVNLHEYPTGRCWRCAFQPEIVEHPLDEPNIRVSIPRQKEASNGNR